jgi:hypothetical protein
MGQLTVLKNIDILGPETMITAIRLPKLDTKPGIFDWCISGISFSVGDRPSNSKFLGM